MALYSIKRLPAVRLLFLFLLAVVYCFFIFYYPFAFNYELGINFHYYLFTICLLFFTILLTLVIFSRHFQFTIIDAVTLVLTTVFLVLFVFQIQPAILGNEYVSVCFAVLTLFFMMRVFNITLLNRSTIFLLSGIFMVELIVAGWQLIFSHAHYIPGTLVNSGIFSCYLVMHMPLFYFMLTRLPAKVKPSHLVAFFLLVIFILIIICLNRSRTAILSFLFIGLVMLFLDYREIIYRLPTRTMKWPIIICVIVLVSTGIYFTKDIFLGKKISVHGRIMKWDICARHVGDSPWVGIGFGKFTHHYPGWQAEYFSREQNIPLNYTLSADESYVLFNEYLQLLLEIGVIGFLVISFIVYDFFRTEVAHDLQTSRLAKLIFLAVLSFGFTSYPFYCTFFLFSIALCFATIYAGKNKNTFLTTRVSNTISTWGLVLLLPLSLYGCNIAITQTFSSERSLQLLDDYFTEKKISNERYASLYDDLKTDGKFLLAYGESLAADSVTITKGIQLIEESKSYFISYRTYSSAAIAYQDIGNYKKALASYAFLSCFIPNDFYPKYEMALIHHQTGDKDGLQRIGEIILSMPVKTPSAQVNRMKNKISRLLEKEKLQ